MKKTLVDNYIYERELYTSGIELIAGTDEAGRGPLAGPVVAACVIMPKDHRIDGVDDSKKVSEKNRYRLYDEIIKNAISVGVGIVDEKTIDEINILNATKIAFEKAYDDLSIKPQHILIDALGGILKTVPQTVIIKGDSLSYQIAAASIVAKVTRDRLMINYDSVYPKYNFSKHKGYGTKEHMQALREFGICPIHRHSFLKNIEGISL